MSGITINEKGHLCLNGQPAYKNGMPILVKDTSGNSNLPFAVQETETAGGIRTSSRLEKPGILARKKTFSLSLLNTHAANTYTAVIFDGSGFIADDLGASSPTTLNGVVVVGGSKGTSSLAALKTIALGSAMDVHEMHIRGKAITAGDGATAANAGTGTPLSAYTVANDGTILEGDNFDYAAKADFTTNASTTPFALETETDGGTFDSTVRKVSIRFQGQFMTAIIVTLPPLKGAAMTFTYNAISASRNMDLV